MTIGSVLYVRTYVRTQYVRSFLCSSFVITLATSFIIQFRYNFTQVLGMTIPRTIRVSARQGQGRGHSDYFLKNNCHHSSAFIYGLILILFHTNV